MNELCHVCDSVVMLCLVMKWNSDGLFAITTAPSFLRKLTQSVQTTPVYQQLHYHFVLYIVDSTYRRSRFHRRLQERFPNIKHILKDDKDQQISM